MTNSEKKKFCKGCYCDIYNGGLTKECRSLGGAELVLRKEVHINQAPPWNQKPRKVLSCYHKQQFVYVNPDVTC